MRRLIQTAAVLAMMALSFGCEGVRAVNTAPPRQQPVTSQDQRSYMPRITVMADDESEGGSSDAVRAALEWSEKYARLSEVLRQVQAEKFAEAEKVRKLQEQQAIVDTELAQARKELKEANEMLVEMHKELVRWKKDVLGFRDEMRRAQQTQLAALARILNLLGAETPNATTQPAESVVAGNRKGQ